MSYPLISIVIPTYNRKNVLLETLNSIKHQKYQNWEVIVVDDGSTDGTNSFMQEVCKASSQINYYLRSDFTTKKGAPVCRNLGLEKAKGDYVVFLDSDDILQKETLHNRVNSINESKDYDFLIFQGAFFTESIDDSDRLWNKFTQENDLNRFLRGDVVWQTTGPLWKRSYLINSSLRFDEEAKSSQDWEFHVHALLQNPRYKKIDGKPDYFIRRDAVDKHRISEGHYSIKSYFNRIPLIKKILPKLNDVQEYELHKYLVRDTLAVLRNTSDIDIINTFEETNRLFASNINKNWGVVVKMMYYLRKKNLKTCNRILLRCLNFWKPYYFRKFKQNYRAKY
ncbi:glycosyltransferase family 2 protein [Winogradskyella sp. SYSU M77433]|uniref:glycosyltransferase family 2 protein n=1 Tax=Winogradskyella sp. SYSU M77433 TaxID=3042722 RepID=UPI0024803C32|nr:glycosyltransferase family 2 protein [Winogradskyella sp. SYSU M77433]MDH7911521.1 glycosyltransferase [Winogradskyella sp. SYSU M77433]